MASYLENQITERRKALADLDRRRVVLEAELRAYEDAFRHERPAPQAPTAAANKQTALDLNTPENVERIAAFNRLSVDWRNVLQTLSSRQVFRSSHMLEAAQEQGMQTSLPNVRSQLTLLTQRGILRRVDTGEYSVEPVQELLRMLG